jgi:hypothetical protein
MEGLRPLFAGVVTFIAPGASVVVAALLVASPGGIKVTSGEWLSAIMAAILASAGVEARVAARIARERRRRQEEDHE